MPGLLIEGMIIAAYAVGAVEGTIYLRAEYRYLKSKLEEVIRKFEWNNWLGKDILGIEGFDFSLKIQLGAGAYVCGEETALLQSMEGKRGEPRPRKYFPVERGFLDKPTVVNNVETLCAAARILELGVKHFRNCGTPTSPGTKILSISGDCLRPGIYEVQWGLNIGELLDMCGAEDAFALQLSGPSGTLIPASQRERKISIDDLRCGGSVMIFNQNRDLLQILQNYNRFFMSESCGTCTPCRAGNFLLFRQLRAFKRGLADLSDIQKLEELGQMMRFSSRCGLGQAAPNSILDSIKYFRDKWDEMAISNGQPLNKLFDLEDATAEYDQYIKEFNQE
jgi:[NiFe] hydrogenase diaphorase moiety large subunit